MLEIQSLSVAYQETLVLQEVSLTVRPGEILALIGPNGAGKSTLVRAVSGLLPARAGMVRIKNQPVDRLSTMEKARFMAVVPQARELPGAFSVYQTVLLGRTPYLNWLGSPGKSDHAQVRRALEQAQVSDLADRLVGTLSGGEQQRVLLARALAQSTPVLLLDEPTTHLDLQHQSHLLNLIRQLVDESGLAVLMVIHDLNLAGLYADRVALIEEGRIRAAGRPEEVLTQKHLSALFQVPVNVIPHPDYGTPLILPDGKLNGNKDRKNTSPSTEGESYFQELYPN